MTAPWKMIVATVICIALAAIWNWPKDKSESAQVAAEVSAQVDTVWHQDSLPPWETKRAEK